MKRKRTPSDTGERSSKRLRASIQLHGRELSYDPSHPTRVFVLGQFDPFLLGHGNSLQNLKERTFPNTFLVVGVDSSICRFNLDVRMDYVRGCRYVDHAIEVAPRHSIDLDFMSTHLIDYVFIFLEEGAERVVPRQYQLPEDRIVFVPFGSGLRENTAIRLICPEIFAEAEALKKALKGALEEQSRLIQEGRELGIL